MKIDIAFIKIEILLSLYYTQKTPNMNFVSKTFTTLPAEICNIIYQYYKPQYIVDIENIDKHSLLKNWFDGEEDDTVNYLANMFDGYDDAPDGHHPYFEILRKPCNEPQYILYYYYVERSIQYCRTEDGECSYENSFIYLRQSVLCSDFHTRDDIKTWCQQNGIKSSRKVPRKTMIKKLMKL